MTDETDIDLIIEKLGGRNIDEPAIRHARWFERNVDIRYFTSNAGRSMACAD